MSGYANRGREAARRGEAAALEHAVINPPNSADASRALRRLTKQLDQRFAPVHERRLTRAVRLAKMVESSHGAEVDCPRGAGAHLAELARCLSAHRREEDQILSAALADRHRAETSTRLKTLRDQHGAIGQHLMRLAVLTHDFTPPPGVDRTWRTLCRICRDLDHDLREQMRLEDNVIYPSLGSSNDTAASPKLVRHVVRA